MDVEQSNCRSTIHLWMNDIFLSYFYRWPDLIFQWNFFFSLSYLNCWHDKFQNAAITWKTEMTNNCHCCKWMSPPNVRQKNWKNPGINYLAYYMIYLRMWYSNRGCYIIRRSALTHRFSSSKRDWEIRGTAGPLNIVTKFQNVRGRKSPFILFCIFHCLSRLTKRPPKDKAQ